MKKFIFILSILLLVLPFSVLGAVEYERTPANYSICSPVVISASVDNWDDYNFPDTANYYRSYIGAFDEPAQDTIGEICYASSTLSFVEAIPLVLGDYEKVGIFAFPTLIACEDFLDPVSTWYYEDGDGEIIFEVIEGVSANFVPISGSFISGVVAYIDDIAIGIWTIIALVVGVPLAFWVIGKVIEIPKLKK